MNKETSTNDKETPARVGSADGSALRSMTPGCGWTRPYQPAAHVWEDREGNRVIVHNTINGLTLRDKCGKIWFHYDSDEPLKTSLRRNGCRRRAGLSAARIIFSQNNSDEPIPAHPNQEKAD